MKAIIVGGGIGGLTTALMLRSRGIGCEIFEQADTIRELGVGINTLPHAMRELAGLGLLQKLDREELQGVIAHELSHVRNYDIRFSLMVGVLVGSIALLADFFLRFTFWGGGPRRGRAAAGSRS